MTATTPIVAGWGSEGVYLHVSYRAVTIHPMLRRIYHAELAKCSSSIFTNPNTGWLSLL